MFFLACIACQDPSTSDETIDSSEVTPALMCTRHSDCDAAGICLPNGFCGEAWGRLYRLEVSRLHFAELTPDGSAWDDDGTPPDPECFAYGLNPRWACFDANVFDTICTTQSLVVEQDTAFKFQCVDEDRATMPMTPSQILGEFCFDEACGPIPPAMIRAEEPITLRDTATGAEMVFRFVVELPGST